MSEIDFITPIHRATPRDYLGRVNAHDKAVCAEIAGRFDHEYWDGERHTGYGGYRNDGRWRPVAEAMVGHYGLKADARILDVGCGKSFLLYELTRLLPRARVAGLDISHYGLAHAQEELRDRGVRAHAARLPFPGGHFDFVLSINTLHNLYIDDLFAALAEMERVARGPRYLVVEAYRNAREKVNLMYWQLTCHAFHTPAEWRWIFERAGYRGDHGFIYFE